MSSSCRPLQLWKGYRGHCWTAWLDCWALPLVTSVAPSHTEITRNKPALADWAEGLHCCLFNALFLQFLVVFPGWRNQSRAVNIQCGISAVNGYCESICPECSTCSFSIWFDFLLPAHLNSEFLCLPFPYYWPLFCPLIDLLNQPVWYSCFCVQTSCILKTAVKFGAFI